MQILDRGTQNFISNLTRVYISIKSLTFYIEIKYLTNRPLRQWLNYKCAYINRYIHD